MFLWWNSTKYIKIYITAAAQNISAMQSEWAQNTLDIRVAQAQKTHLCKGSKKHVWVLEGFVKAIPRRKYYKQSYSSGISS